MSSVQNRVGLGYIGYGVHFEKYNGYNIHGPFATGYEILKGMKTHVSGLYTIDEAKRMIDGGQIFE